MGKRAESEKKWYQGRGNMITVLMFISGLWPVALPVMWILSGWSKRVKVLLSLLPIIGLLIIYLGLGAGQSVFASQPQRYLVTSRKIINYATVSMAISLIASLILTIFSDRLRINKSKLWVTELVFLLIAGLVVIFFAMGSVGAIYSITK